MVVAVCHMMQAVVDHRSSAERKDAFGAVQAVAAAYVLQQVATRT